MIKKQSRQNTAGAIVHMLKEHGDNKQLARRIAAFLIEQGQVKQLDSLMRDVMQIRADQGLLELTATSAFPLTPEIIKRVEQLASDMHDGVNKVISNKVVEPHVLGGVRIETPGAQIDLTVRAKLDQLKQATKSQRITHGFVS